MSPTLEDFEKRFGLREKDYLHRKNPFFIKSDIKRFIPSILDDAASYVDESLLKKQAIQELFRWHRTDSRNHFGKLLYYRVDPKAREMEGIIILENVKFQNINMSEEEAKIFDVNMNLNEEDKNIPWIYGNSCTIIKMSKDIFESSTEFYDTLLDCNIYCALFDSNIKMAQDNQEWNMILGVTKEQDVLFPVIYSDTEGKRREVLEFLLAEQEAIKEEE